MENKLRKCRTCGHDGKLFSFVRKAFGMWEIQYFFVKCTNCGRRSANTKSEETAVEEWNRRNGA